MLADYISNVLRSGQRRWIEAHLAECSECAKELRALDGVLALIDANTPMQEPPKGLWNGVANRIASPQAPRRSLGHWLTTPLQLAGVGAAAMAVILAIILGGPQNDPVVPVRMASSNEYIQGHALYAAQAPLADRVSYLSLISSDESQTK